MSSERGLDGGFESERVFGVDRRAFLKLASAAGAATLISKSSWADNVPAFQPTTAAAQRLVRFPEKTDLILLTDRPPQLETPLKYFKTDLTPNDAMFVRWHLAGIPTSVDLDTFRLVVGGHVERPLRLSMADLKKYEAVSVIAVNQCSGNSRASFQPRVPGGQWQNGAMGNARWTGVRLRDLLTAARVKAGAIEVSFQGLDRPPLPATPAFIKALAFDRANDGEVLVAYAMNDQPLPMLNGFPLRLIVPGWFATYWVKALNEINVMDQKFKGFWMDKAYRVPNNPECQETPKDQAKDTVPISKMLVRAVFVNEPGERVANGEVEGVAFDGGSGIRQVDISGDGGKTWSPATLGEDLGKYSWRRWKFALPPVAFATVMARATNNAGESQPAAQNWNHSGYARNAIETIDVRVR